MGLPELLSDLRGDPRFMETVAVWRTLPARPARTAPLPDQLHPLLRSALERRGITQLFTHQQQALEHTLRNQSIAVVTPTASGKTLCYNLPVFHTLLSNPGARALYLFPTKALAQDQLVELNRLARALKGERQKSGAESAGRHFVVASYDGDTPAGQRRIVRKTAQIVLTNPDMLHVGMLPFHTQWADFWAGLRWVVVDEMHTYRGVFGSHVANVLRRLRRICRHYGADPRFICTSATIANPAALAERLVEQPVHLIDDNGAPSGAKHIVLVNPPLVDPEKGIRRSAVLESTDLAARCLSADVQTLVFGRSRLTTELLLTYLRQKSDRLGGPPFQSEGPSNGKMPSAIRGYRGGYLPTERRAIEAGLRSGAVRAVVATNALELGIDIGQLQAVLICGYPGSIASAWQQMGRAGRTTEAALAILVASSGVLDQYLIEHPEFLFTQSPEYALINADNLMLLLDHVRCAAFELPFEGGESFGRAAFLSDVMQLLIENGELQEQGDRCYWSGNGYPARAIGLRSAGPDSVVIQVLGRREVDMLKMDSPAAADRAPTVIGQVDYASAHYLVHDGAIYLHEGQTYLVERLDLARLHADVIRFEADYYTEAMSDTEISVDLVHDSRLLDATSAHFGDVTVQSQLVGFRRVKRFTHETLGVESLSYPPSTLTTTAYWLAIRPTAQATLEQAGLWYDSVNDYGPNWQEQRARVRVRDRYRCVQCGRPEVPGQEHDVHHKLPFRSFGYVPGVNDRYCLANELENLMLVCRGCHRRLETAGRLRTGLDGLAYVLANLAPLHLMCDRTDLGVHVARSEQRRRSGDKPESWADGATEGKDAAIYLYERVPAGLGFSAQLFELHSALLQMAHELVARCPCGEGCPSCIGPVLVDAPAQLETKRLTLGLLRELSGEAF